MRVFNRGLALGNGVCNKAFVNTASLNAKGVLDSLKILYQHDLIEKDETNRIIVIDPVLVYWTQA